MKLTVMLAVIAMAMVAGGFLVFRAQASRNAEHQRRPLDEMYVGLRDLALNTKAADIGLSPKAASEPYGIVMDIDASGGTATITSFETGDASLYFSTGGGAIGAGQSSTDVTVAAKKFVAASAPLIRSMTKASSKPLPKSGQVAFYVLTGDGVYAATRPQQQLGEQRDEFSPLFYAGQEVLTQIRLIDEKRDEDGQQ